MKKIRLIDYECLTENNQRIIAFGKYAGIAGSYNALIAFGHKYNFLNSKDLVIIKTQKTFIGSQINLKLIHQLK